MMIERKGHGRWPVTIRVVVDESDWEIILGPFSQQI